MLKLLEVFIFITKLQHKSLTVIGVTLSVCFLVIFNLKCVCTKTGVNTANVKCTLGCAKLRLGI